LDGDAKKLDACGPRVANDGSDSNPRGLHGDAKKLDNDPCGPRVATDGSILEADSDAEKLDEDALGPRVTIDGSILGK
jgi:hypothetical protein